MNAREGAVSGRLHRVRARWCDLGLSDVVLIACVLMSLSAAHAGDLPDYELTPGVTNPAVTQENIGRTVCVKGYTKTIRPPTNYSNSLKKKQILEYHYSDTNPRDYEEDHLIALSIGGAPYDPRNLWPEPRRSEWNAAKKDQLEFVMYKLVPRLV